MQDNSFLLPADSILRNGSPPAAYGSLWPSRWRGLSLGVPQVMISHFGHIHRLVIVEPAAGESLSGKSCTSMPG